MANWSDLKAAVASIVKTNGNKEITGQLLQNVLNNIISNVGLNSSFAGIATPETNPGSPDGNVFYLATKAGTYSNFNGIVINSGEAVILEWKGSWVKKDSGFATQEELLELGSELDTITGKVFLTSTMPKQNVNLTNKAIGDIWEGYSNVNSGASLSDKFTCNEGDVFIVKTYTGANQATWGFLDSNNVILNVDNSNQGWRNYEITAPKGAVYLLFMIPFGWEEQCFLKLKGNLNLLNEQVNELKKSSEDLYLSIDEVQKDVEHIESVLPKKKGEVLINSSLDTTQYLPSTGNYTASNSNALFLCVANLTKGLKKGRIYFSTSDKYYITRVAKVIGGVFERKDINSNEGYVDITEDTVEKVVVGISSKDGNTPITETESINFFAVFGILDDVASKKDVEGVIKVGDDKFFSELDYPLIVSNIDNSGNYIESETYGTTNVKHDLRKGFAVKIKLAAYKNIVCYCWNKNGLFLGRLDSNGSIKSSGYTVDNTLEDSAVETIIYNNTGEDIVFDWRINTDSNNIESDSNNTNVFVTRLAVTEDLREINKRVSKLEQSYFTTIENFKDYFYEEIKDTISKIKSLTNNEDTAVFAVVSDPHYSYDTRGVERIDENIANIKAVASEIELHGVICLGDMISSGLGRNGVTDDKIYKQIGFYIERYRKEFQKYFVINGNHDGDSADFFNNNKFKSYNDWNDWFVKREIISGDAPDSDNPYFYYDINDLKLRLIFLSIPTSTDETRMTNGITGQYPSEREVNMYWGAGEEQLQWLANKALNTENEWSVVVFSHTPICFEYSNETSYGYYPIIRDLMGRVEDKDRIEGIISSYHNHSPYSDNTISVDFTTKLGTSVLCAIAGHVHYERIINAGETINADNYNTNGLPCKYYIQPAEALWAGGTKTDKTVTQEQFDFVVINKAKSKVSFVRFGLGNDRNM